MKPRLKFILRDGNGWEAYLMAEGYKTKQRAFIVELLKEYRGRHLTAEEIATLLEQRGNAVGKATVYRCLERLIEQGGVKKYLFGEGKSACYEYQLGQQSPHYHLKCSQCGALTHLECEYLDSLPEHVYEHHGFTLDAAQIMLVGCCEQCTKKQQAQQEDKKDEKQEKRNKPKEGGV